MSSIEPGADIGQRSMFDVGGGVVLFYVWGFPFLVGVWVVVSAREPGGSRPRVEARMEPAEGLISVLATGPVVEPSWWLWGGPRTFYLT